MLSVFPIGARAELDTDVVVIETDSRTHAIMYYQKRGQITMKLYGGFLSIVAPVWLVGCKNLVVVVAIF